MKEPSTLITHMEVGKNPVGYDVIFLIADNHNIELDGHCCHKGNWEFYFSYEDKVQMIRYTSDYTDLMPLIHKEDNQFSIVLVPYDFIVGN